MVIFVPHGDSHNDARPPELYDRVDNFLLQCGLKRLVMFGNEEVAASS
jgi:hypothetical protein